MNAHANLPQRAADQRPVRVVKVARPVTNGQSLSGADGAMGTGTHAYRIPREMEQMFAGDKKQ